jgi:hypothetical protein
MGREKHSARDIPKTGNAATSPWGRRSACDPGADQRPLNRADEQSSRAVLDQTESEPVGLGRGFGCLRGSRALRAKDPVLVLCRRLRNHGLVGRCYYARVHHQLLEEQTEFVQPILWERSRVANLSEKVIMAAYVLERARWVERVELIPAARVLKEEEVRQWLRSNDWHWYLEDDEARAQFHHLATGIRDVQKKELPSAPDIDIGDELLLIGYVSRATADSKKPGKPIRRRGPEWLYRIYRRSAPRQD